MATEIAHLVPQDLVFPGGMQQRFRYTRPLVEDLLEGYVQPIRNQPIRNQPILVYNQAANSTIA